MRIVAALVATFVAQRMLSLPGMPVWAGDVWLPMVWVVGPALLHSRPRWPYAGIGMGLAWDVTMEPLIGPGGIAWSAAQLAVGAAAAVVAGRRTRTWVGLGALGAVVVIAGRAAALLPLGQAEPLDPVVIARTAVLTGAWCGLVGWFLAADLPARWQSYRARRLR